MERSRLPLLAPIMDVIRISMEGIIDGSMT